MLYASGLKSADPTDVVLSSHGPTAGFEALGDGSVGENMSGSEEGSDDEAEDMEDDEDDTDQVSTY